MKAEEFYKFERDFRDELDKNLNVQESLQVKWFIKMYFYKLLDFQTLLHIKIVSRASWESLSIL